MAGEHKEWVAEIFMTLPYLAPSTGKRFLIFPGPGNDDGPACMATPSRRRRQSRRRFRQGWRRAIWKCIRTRPGSSTARMEVARAWFAYVDHELLFGK